jgi:hypothetical protein
MLLMQAMKLCAGSDRPMRLMIPMMARIAVKVGG